MPKKQSVVREPTKHELEEWLQKEIKRINKSPKKYHYVNFTEPQVYINGKKIIIASIEEDDAPNEYFLTTGTYPRKLKVKHVSIQEKTIGKHIKNNFEMFRRKPSLNKIVEFADLE
jgi:hypothetical protein